MTSCCIGRASTRAAERVSCSRCTARASVRPRVPRRHRVRARRVAVLVADGRAARSVPCAARAERLRAARTRVVVDHGIVRSRAPSVVFVHNVASRSRCGICRRAVSAAAAAAGARSSSARSALDALVVANSKLIAAALGAHFRLARERVRVLYPGYDARVASHRSARPRCAPPRAARSPSTTASPLVGLVTPGDFTKRGLTCVSIARRASHRRAARCALPRRRLQAAARDAQRGLALLRRVSSLIGPRAAARSVWFAALDLFLCIRRGSRSLDGGGRSAGDGRARC